MAQFPNGILKEPFRLPLTAPEAVAEELGPSPYREGLTLPPEQVAIRVIDRSPAERQRERRSRLKIDTDARLIADPGYATGALPGSL